LTDEHETCQDIQVAQHNLVKNILNKSIYTIYVGETIKKIQGLTLHIEDMNVGV
jgi:hypothetical protein